MKARYQCAQVPLCSISAVVPQTGHLIEVLSEHVDRREKGAFRRWPGDSCPKANEVEQSVMEMRRAWHGAGGRMVNVNGFPDLLIVKVAAPANIDKFASFVSATLGDVSETVSMAAEMYSADDDAGSGVDDDAEAVPGTPSPTSG